jgi:hypothetical protein
VHRIGQDPVGLAQNPGVVIEPAEEAAVADLRLAGEGEACGQGASPLFQPLDAQQLGAEAVFRRDCACGS